MGTDKRFLFIGNRTLLERSLKALQDVFDRVCIVIGVDHQMIETTVPVFRDLIPKRGSLGGIYTGLKLSQTPYVFAVACDMPFVSQAVIRYLVYLKDGADLVMPRLEIGPQPTHAVYSRRCLPAIEKMVQSEHLKIKDLLKATDLRVRWVETAEISALDPDGRSFLNVNTCMELETAKKMAANGNESHWKS